MTYDTAPQGAETVLPITAYIDESCLGNNLPGRHPGGYAVLVERPDEGPKEWSVHVPETTNNRPALMAAISVLESVGSHAPITIFSDSKYVVDGVTKYLAGWKVKGWRKADGKPLKNDDLWKALDALLVVSKATFQWVKGHSGIEGNERVDYLATEAAYGRTVDA